MSAAQRRLLLVHAHPDDETINTGTTMARYAASGAHVALLTCTLGEEGEVVVPSLTQLAADQADQLGGYRIGELHAALGALGVSDQRFLGGAGRFRDSGMIGTPANNHPRAFWQAASQPVILETAVQAAVDAIRDVRPHVVVTYDPSGGYGHPDHVMAHRITMRAVDAAADPSYGRGTEWQVSKIYWTVTPRSVLQRGVAAVRAAAADIPFVIPNDGDRVEEAAADETVTTVIDGSEFLSAKTAALRAHATQASVNGRFFALADGVGRELDGVEYFQLVQGELGTDRDADGREVDLFSGVST